VQWGGLITCAKPVSRWPSPHRAACRRTGIRFCITIFLSGIVKNA
jgi:hypothetical protein